MIVLDDGVIWELRFNQLIFQEILEKIGTALIFLMVICFVARATWCFDDKERRKALLTKIKKFFQKLWSKLKRK
jgi:hypothetical protein